MWHMRGSANTCLDAFDLFPGIGWVSSTQVEIQFVSFGQQSLDTSCVWPGMGLFSTD